MDNPNFIFYIPTAPLAIHRLRNVLFSHTSHFTGRLIVEFRLLKNVFLKSCILFCIKFPYSHFLFSFFPFHSSLGTKISQAIGTVPIAPTSNMDCSHFQLDAL
jgi:hypothetical protein